MRPARIAALAAAATATALVGVPPVFAANSAAQPLDDVPGVVTITRVGPGGGSGEVILTWEALTSATGYRVLRSETAEGAFEVAAELDVTTGAATAADGIANIYSDHYSYVPQRRPFEGPDESPQFSLVDAGFRQRCFRVIAFNAAGDGPASDVACGVPPGFGSEPPTPTTTDSPPTTATTVPPPSTTTRPQAPPATPVPAQPSFTG